MLFWYNIDFLNDQNREKFQKKWREAIGNQRSTKTEEFVLLRKFRSQKSHPGKKVFPSKRISQPREPSCENRVMLRKEGPPTKQFRSHKNPPAKNFVAAKLPPGTRVPFRNPKAHFAATKWAAKPSKAKFRRHKPSPAKNFPTTKPPLGTRVSFRSPQSPFRSCETLCEIPLLLRNPHLAAKWPYSCENPNRQLNTYLSL